MENLTQRRLDMKTIENLYDEYRGKLYECDVDRCIHAMNKLIADMIEIRELTANLLNFKLKGEINERT